MIPKISIIINGEERFIESDTSIKTLVEKLDLDIKKIAIEKNYEIIMPENFGDDVLMDGDRIEIVHFIGGG